MRFGLPLSAALHGALFLGAFLSLPAAKPLPEILQALPVELVHVADITNLYPVPAPAPEPVKPKPAPRPAPAPKPVKATPVPVPEPAKPAPEPAKPAPAPAPEPVKPEAEPVSETIKPRPAPPVRQVKEKPPDFDVASISALLNKIPDPEPVERERQKKETQEVETRFRQTAAEVSLSEIDAFKQKMRGCWNAGALAGARNAGRLVVDVRVRLLPSGYMIGDPEIINNGEIAAGGSLYRSASEAVLRAIRRCNPYDHLPPEKYDRWKTLRLRFDPSEMAGAG